MTHLIIGGLDSATTSGLAVMDGDRLQCAYAFKAEGENEGALFSSYRSWLTEMLCEYKVEHLAIEAPLPTNRGTFQVKTKVNDIFGASIKKVAMPMSSQATWLRLYGLRAHALQICEELGIQWTEINVREWRGAIYGTRNAPKGVKDASGWWKQKALDRCRLLGWEVSSKDAAEACAIADYMRVKLNPRFSALTGELFELHPKRRSRRR